MEQIFSLKLSKERNHCDTFKGLVCVCPLRFSVRWLDLVLHSDTMQYGHFNYSERNKRGYTCVVT